MSDCGGCQNKGAHRRWCSAVVGFTASIWGRQSEEIEAIADSVGGNVPLVSNLLYSAAGQLRAEALGRAKEWQEAVADDD